MNVADYVGNVGDTVWVERGEAGVQITLGKVAAGVLLDVGEVWELIELLAEAAGLE